jgi:hypothetical protein
MALNGLLKHMPSMGYEMNEFAKPAELDFMNFTQNNRVLAAPPFENVSLSPQ